MGIDWNTALNWKYGTDSGSGLGGGTGADGGTGTGGGSLAADGVRVIGHSSVPSVVQAIGGGVYSSHSVIEIPLAEALERWCTIKGIWQFPASSTVLLRVRLEATGGASVWEYIQSTATTTGSVMACEFLFWPNGTMVSNNFLTNCYGNSSGMSFGRTINIGAATSLKIHFQSGVTSGSPAGGITLHGYKATLAGRPQ